MNLWLIYYKFFIFRLFGFGLTYGKTYSNYFFAFGYFAVDEGNWKNIDKVISKSVHQFILTISWLHVCTNITHTYVGYTLSCNKYQIICHHKPTPNMCQQVQKMMNLWHLCNVSFSTYRTGGHGGIVFKIPISIIFCYYCNDNRKSNQIK
jgi:hypothetical protein